MGSVFCYRVFEILPQTKNGTPQALPAPPDCPIRLLIMALAISVTMGASASLAIHLLSTEGLPGSSHISFTAAQNCEDCVKRHAS
jgi:hypothetical protein